MDNFNSVRSSTKKVREGDPKIWKQVDNWFAQLDLDNNGYLDKKEVKPYIEEYLAREFGIEPSNGLVQDTFNDIAFDGKNVSKQGIYDHIMATKIAFGEAQKTEAQKKKQPVKKLSSKLEQHQQQKPLSVQSRISVNSQIQQEQASQAYHTQTEDIGDAIFPQIMRYTETGP